MRNGRNSSARRARLTVLVAAFVIIIWAATLAGGAAHLRAPERAARGDVHAYLFGQSINRIFGGSNETRTSDEQPNASGAVLPRVVRFREVGGRGLLVKTWVNGAGPYTFALDTGAGATILSRRVAAEARVAFDGGRALEIGGLSGQSVVAARRAFPRGLSLGEPQNVLPARGLTVVSEGLPPDVDGVLDPTEAFSPLGYVIDLPRNEISAFDPRTRPVRKGFEAADETVVAWLTDGASRRPFVVLAGGRRALLDTGSGFGLAVTESAARAIGINTYHQTQRNGVRDIAGGHVAARRVSPSTIRVGSLALRGVPTDLLLGAEAGSPVLLGRDALRPFQLTFDPLSKLIRIKAR